MEANKIPVGITSHFSSEEVGLTLQYLGLKPKAFDNFFSLWKFTLVAGSSGADAVSPAGVAFPS